MDKKLDRLRRQQQRMWRKSARSILLMHQNITILIAFFMITILGILWVMLENKLDHHLTNQTRTYGYGISRYASTDLERLILTKNTKAQKNYLIRITNDPFIIEATLFDDLGVILATHSSHPETTNESTQQSLQSQTRQTLIEDILSDDKRVGILQLVMDQEQQNRPIRKLMNRISLSTVVMMIVTTFLAWLLAKRLTYPLRKLIKMPMDSPDDTGITSIDVSSELRLMLESTTASSDSPAPVSRAEEAGIHQLLAADSITEPGNLIVMKLCLPDLSTWLKPDSGRPNVRLLRQLDRLLIVTIHSQQGHLLNFDGITAQACFGLDGNMDTAVYRALSCSLLLHQLLNEISLSPKVCIRDEERLLIRHMNRTPVAIPIHSLDDENERMQLSSEHWLLLNKNISRDKRLLEQIELVNISDNWSSIKNTHYKVDSMIERQLTWIKFLLENSKPTS